jgi:hypothetical protein
MLHQREHNGRQRQDGKPEFPIRRLFFWMAPRHVTRRLFASSAGDRTGAPNPNDSFARMKKIEISAPVGPRKKVNNATQGSKKIATGDK